MTMADTDVIRFTDPETPDRVMAHARRLVNGAVHGRLELHYETRTVVLSDLDGDVAMRVIALLRDYDDGDPTSTRWADHCDPERSDAVQGWLSFTPARAFGSRWRPERLVPARPVVRSAIKLIRADLDVNTMAAWGREHIAAYIAVFNDLARVEGTEPIEARTPAPDDAAARPPDDSNHDDTDDADAGLNENTSRESSDDDKCADESDPTQRGDEAE